jgi:hypothetical protein
MSDDGVLKWGALTNVGMRLQFPLSKLDRLSLATTPIVILADDRRLGHSSGFFWRTSSSVWLITNWHCVTGNNPFTRKALGADSPPPTKIVFYPLRLNSVEDGKVHFPTRISSELQLFESGTPAWMQHSDFEKSRADIVAIRVCDVGGTNEIRCVNEFEPIELFHHVGADLFVVGYPLDNFEGWMLPFWKRGSFAGEPLFPLADKPLFPIDVLSTEGMSGSPVFRRVFGPKASPDAATIAVDNIVATEFVGVYAGRLASKELERVGIGYGWYGYLVDEIVNSGTPGTTC